jgi:hypothetical protein
LLPETLFDDSANIKQTDFDNFFGRLMTPPTDTALNGNRTKKLKKVPPTKILTHRTLHTFAFACYRTSQPEGKVKRVQSPTLYQTG